MLYLEQFDVSFHDLKDCNSPEFNKLYAIYSQAFPMEDEREPPEAFEQIHKLIDDPNIQAKFGPYSEVVSTIRRGRDGEVIGGMIFGITTSAAHRTAGVLASVQGIYVFFSPNIRGQKQTRGRVPMRVIFDYFRSVARSIYGSHGETGEVVIFLECNNPLIMSGEEIAADIQSSGINPFRRYRFWMRSVAAQPLDFSYIQPRLRPDAEPVNCLDLCAVRESNRQISSELLRLHLYRFCSVSVLKGVDAHEDADFSKMDTELQKCDFVPLLSYDSDKVSTILSKLDVEIIPFERKYLESVISLVDDVITIRLDRVEGVLESFTMIADYLDSNALTENAARKEYISLRYGLSYFVALTASGEVVGVSGLYSIESGYLSKVGFACSTEQLAELEAPQNLWIGWTAVSKELQGCGIGSKLIVSIIEKAKELLKETGVKNSRLMVVADNRSTGFYEKFGMRCVLPWDKVSIYSMSINHA